MSVVKLEILIISWRFFSRFRTAAPGAEAQCHRSVTVHIFRPNFDFPSWKTPASSIMKVVLLGATSGSGPPLASLLGLNDDVEKLVLFDLSPGVQQLAADLHFVAAGCPSVRAMHGLDQLPNALSNARLVCISHGPDFDRVAPLLKRYAQQIANFCPATAVIAVLPSPCTAQAVSLVASVLEANGTFDARKLLGVVDVKEKTKRVLNGHSVPVIGGPSPKNTVPIVSKAGIVQEASAKRTIAAVQGLPGRGWGFLSRWNGGGEKMVVCSCWCLRSMLRC